MKKRNKSEVEFIVCPHCSSTEFSIEENGMGKCNYCGASFIVHTTKTATKNVTSHKSETTNGSETTPEYVCHVDLNPKPEKPAKNAYGHTEDKSFDKAIKTSFVKFLPLWISTWLSLIYSIIVFSVCIKYDLAYTNNDLALALNIVSIVLTPSLLTASATCTLLKGKRIFLQKDYELLEKICEEKPLTKKEKKKLFSNANFVWSNCVDDLLPNEYTSGIYGKHHFGQIIGFIVFPIVVLLIITGTAMAAKPPCRHEYKYSCSQYCSICGNAKTDYNSYYAHHDSDDDGCCDWCGRRC